MKYDKSEKHLEIHRFIISFNNLYQLCLPGCNFTKSVIYNRTTEKEGNALLFQWLGKGEDLNLKKARARREAPVELRAASVLRRPRGPPRRQYASAAQQTRPVGRTTTIVNNGFELFAIVFYYHLC